MNEHIAKLEEKLKKFKKVALINRLKGASAQKLMYLWMVFVESVVGYGSFLMAFPDYNCESLTTRFYRIINKAPKSALNLAKSTPNEFLYHATGVLTAE